MSEHILSERPEQEGTPKEPKKTPVKEPKKTPVKEPKKPPVKEPKKPLGRIEESKKTPVKEPKKPLGRIEESKKPPVKEPKPYLIPKPRPKRARFQKPKRPLGRIEEPKHEGTPFQKPKRPFLRKPKRPKRKRPSRKPLIQSEKQIDYKDTKLLSQFTSDQGKILSKRATKLPLRQQRLITLAIKKARILSFLPFIYNHKNFERIKSTIIRTAKFRNKKKKFKPKRKNRSFFSKK